MKCFVLKLSAVLPEFSLGDLFKLKVSSPGKRRGPQITKHITLEAWIGKDKHKYLRERGSNGLQIIKDITPYRLLTELPMGRIKFGQISDSLI